MSICRYRSRRNLRPHDALQRLRAQVGELKDPTNIEDWIPDLHTSPSSSILHVQSVVPLQPTHGNRTLNHSSSRQKRKMPEDFAIEPRQSARLRKMTPPESIADGVGPKDPSTITLARGRGSRGPVRGLAIGVTGGRGARDIPRNSMESEQMAAAGARGRGARDIPRTTLGVEALSTFGHPYASGSYPVLHADPQKMHSKLRAANNPKTSVSTPSSPSKKSSSPSKTSKPVNKRARMHFLEPRIVFKTLTATKDEGYLTGNLQSLWLDHVYRKDERIIPAEFKVSNP